METAVGTSSDLTYLPACRSVSQSGQTLPSAGVSHSVSLTRHELAFAILIYSHKVTCPELGKRVVAAVRHINPSDWKQKITSCFSFRMKHHVQREMESEKFGSIGSDIFILCKIIHWVIDDLAMFYGGELVDPRQKERLSLQVQGVEVVRYWAFHSATGKVSAREVRSCAALLILILTRFGAKGGLAELATCIRWADTLSPQNSLNGEIYALPSDIVLRTLLYGSLSELRRELSTLFPDAVEDKHLCLGFSSLCKSLVRELSRPTPSQRHNTSSLLASATNNARSTFGKDAPRKIGSLLRGVLTAHNMLVCGRQLSLQELAKVLNDISTLLGSFGLPRAETKAALQSLPLLGSGTEYIGCTVQAEPFAVSEKQKRLLRPRSMHFVGRKEEIAAVKAALTEHTCHASCAVVISGPAGVGKSYLAANVCGEILSMYPRQAWLSCSTEQNLREDMLARLDDSFFVSLQKTSMPFGCKQSPFGKEGGTGGRPFEVSPVHDKWLLVLDDANALVLSLISDILIRPGLSFIITTRSSVVTEFLARQQAQCAHITLQPFSVVESMQLITLKSRQLSGHDQPLPYCSKTLTSVLGNLPLCVGVLSSYLASSAKSRNLTGCNLPNASDATVLLHWREIEKRYRDQFHVRGVEGVVLSSEAYLNEHPLAFLLLVKICAPCRTTIPWQVVSDRCVNLTTVPCVVNRKSGPWFRTLCQDVLGVADWLFSENFQRDLNDCRDALEELGLISFGRTTTTIHIHPLARHSIQAMLETENVCFGRLVATVTRKSELDSEVKVASKMLQKVVSGELLLHILLRSVELLDVLGGCYNQNNDITPEQKYWIFEFLSDLMVNNCQKSLVEILPAEQYKPLQSLLVLALLKYKNSVGLYVSNSEWILWANIYCLCPISSMATSKVISRNANVRQGAALKRQGFAEQAAMHYHTALLEESCLSGEDSIASALLHCKIAQIHEEKQGVAAVLQYIAEATCTCPLLHISPAADDILSAIPHTKDILPNFYNTVKVGTCFYDQLCLWVHLVDTLLKKSLLRDGIVEGNMKETALALIALLRHRQRFLLEKVCQGDDSSALANAIRLQRCLALARETRMEQQLLHSSGKCWRSLNSLMSANRMITDIIRNQGSSFMHGPVAQDFWCEVDGLFADGCLSAWKCGHFTLALTIAKTVREQCDDIGMHQGELVSSLLGRHSESINMQSRSVDDSILAMLCEGMWLTYEKQNFEDGLGKFLAALKRCMLSSKRFLLYKHVGEELVFHHVAHLLALVGDAKPTLSRAFEELLEVSKQCNTMSAIWRRAMERCATRVTSLSQFTQLDSVYKLFKKVKHSSENGGDLSAMNVALKCWKKLAKLHEILPSIDRADVAEVWLILNLQLADYLGKAYLTMQRHDIAEWFMKFCLEYCKRYDWYFLAARFSAQYVEFLEERGQQDTARKQRHSIERMLVDEYGEHYEKWLFGESD